MSSRKILAKVITSHKEMTHILGLTNNLREKQKGNRGWNVECSVISTRKRYAIYHNKGGNDLNFYLLKENSSETISTYLTHMQDGEYIGFQARWDGHPLSRSGHAYSLHAIKEKDRTLLIYVNRASNITVRVFSLSNKDTPDFTKEMIDKAKLENREEMLTFLAMHKDKLDIQLSAAISAQKSVQKTGNCSLANANISWHFQLASKYMQENKVDFLSAYHATKTAYKALRKQDRIKAFRYLLNHRLFYTSRESYFYDCMQALSKFAKDDRRNYLLQAIQEDPESFKQLSSILMSEDFEIKTRAFVNSHLTRDFSSITKHMFHNYLKSATTLACDKLLSLREEILQKTPTLDCGMP